ncbi:MAG TPA: DoxX family protein [Thermoanaerobaculia bacterium]
MSSITIDRPSFKGDTTRRALSAALFSTDASLPLTILRIATAVVLFAHGMQKIGYFGGYGFEGTMGWFTSMGIPWILGVAAIATEIGGAVLLVAGLATRLVAAATVVLMAVAVLKVHLSFGFFMDWGNTLGGEGFEYPLFILVVAVALAIGGAGRASLDRVIAARLK